MGQDVDGERQRTLAVRRFEYETAGLDLADVVADPIEQWHRWFDDAVAAAVTEPEAMAVATVDEHGLPDVRYVLARGVDQRGFTFFTNYGSAKGAQLAANPRAALVFGWLQLHRQVRVRGEVERVSEAESDAYFASRPRASQIASASSAQSSVVADRDEVDRRMADLDGLHPGDVPRPAFWGGYRVRPVEVEFWQGRQARLHDRLRYRRQGDGWVIERLSP